MKKKELLLVMASVLITWLSSSGLANDAHESCPLQGLTFHGNRTFTGEEMAEFSQGTWPVISLITDRENLCDPLKGLLYQSGQVGQENYISHREKRGKRWERPAQVVLYRDGRKEFASPIGLRLSGGNSRHYKDPSFRISFRKRYASRKVPKNLFFDGQLQRRPKKLVLHRANDYITFLATDIAERIGSQTWLYEPARLYLNGHYWGTYFISEQLKKDQWARHRGLRVKSDKDVLPGDDLIGIRLKTEPSDRQTRDWQIYQELKKWILSANTVNISTVSQRVDYENFKKHMLTLAFLGNTDWRQGLAIKTVETHSLNSTEFARRHPWRYIHWDLEHSFLDHASRRNPEIQALHRPAWAQEAFLLLMTGVKWWRREVQLRDFSAWNTQALLFHRLWMEDGEFRKDFSALVRQTLQAPKMLPQQLEEKVAELQEEAELEDQRHDEKISDHPLQQQQTVSQVMTTMAEFTRCRGAFILSQLQKMNQLPLLAWPAHPDSPEEGRERASSLIDSLRENHFHQICPMAKVTDRPH